MLHEPGGLIKPLPRLRRIIPANTFYGMKCAGGVCGSTRGQNIRHFSPARYSPAAILAALLNTVCGGSTCLGQIGPVAVSFRRSAVPLGLAADSAYTGDSASRRGRVPTPVPLAAPADRPGQSAISRALEGGLSRGTKHPEFGAESWHRYATFAAKARSLAITSLTPTTSPAAAGASTCRRSRL